MKTGLVTICLLMLAACATPNELRANSKPITMTSRMEPKLHAQCITRLLVNDGSIVTMIEGNEPGTFEITVRIPGGLGTEALIVVAPHKWGSETKYYFAPVNDELRIAGSLTGKC